MQRIALGIEYDGSHFHGWQKQKNANSVQETLERALSIIAGSNINLSCAGRTDTGVHATHQIVCFDSPVKRIEKAWLRGTHTFLPKTIKILWIKEVGFEFDARRSAKSRRYLYLLYNNPIRPSLFVDYVSWHYEALDENLMRQGSEFWLGEHDFSSFRASFCQSRTPVRTIHSIEVSKRGDIISIEIEANAFLHHMVRNMVGTLIHIGTKKAPPRHALEVLNFKDRRKAYTTAKPQGLYLINVNYADKYNLPIGPIYPIIY